MTLAGQHVDVSRVVVDRVAPTALLIKERRSGQLTRAVAACDGDLYDEPAYPVVMVDPVGVGDAFAAAYLAERVRGRPIAERMSTAACAGAYAVAVSGGWEGLPSREDLAAMWTSEDVVR